jgi:tRNA threonylcarbamoyladenosine biosynthesis protein TsaB
MAIIVSIDTSTSVCSAALHENGHLIASKELHTPQSAASQLAVQLSDLLAETAIQRKDISGIAVSSGPGSYTGLRIGTATAKGLCFGWNVPLMAIDSLSVLAYAVPSLHVSERFCPMIDARRMEVYCRLFNGSMEAVTKPEARIIDADSFAGELDKGKVLFFGDGSSKCREVLRHPNASFLDDVYPAAANMGARAFQLFQAGQYEDLALFEPFYLKEFVAKTKSV